MKRRDFLKTTAPFATLPVLMNGLPIHALGNPETMNILSKAFVNTDHVLVLIQMNGGNDGLNTVIPTDQYSNLTKARSNIMIPLSKVLVLDDVEGNRLSPVNDWNARFVQRREIDCCARCGISKPKFFRTLEVPIFGIRRRIQVKNFIQVG